MTATNAAAAITPTPMSANTLSVLAHLDALGDAEFGASDLGVCDGWNTNVRKQLTEAGILQKVLGEYRFTFDAEAAAVFLQATPIDEAVDAFFEGPFPELAGEVVPISTGPRKAKSTQPSNDRPVVTPSAQSLQVKRAAKVRRTKKVHPGPGPRRLVTFGDLVDAIAQDEQVTQPGFFRATGFSSPNSARRRIKRIAAMGLLVRVEGSNPVAYALPDGDWDTVADAAGITRETPLKGAPSRRKAPRSKSTPAIRIGRLEQAVLELMQAVTLYAHGDHVAAERQVRKVGDLIIG